MARTGRADHTRFPDNLHARRDSIALENQRRWISRIHRFFLALWRHLLLRVNAASRFVRGVATRPLSSRGFTSADNGLARILQCAVERRTAIYGLVRQVIEYGI